MTTNQPKGDDMPNEASALWTGDLIAGRGTFTAGDSLSGDYSFKSRFEDGEGVNPEQLIGAAHAACFSMALATLLADSGHVPESVETKASVACASSTASRRSPQSHSPPSGASQVSTTTASG
jgi:OsmC subfamily peroxiredoxin